jgi:hypothetical protein
MYWSVVYEYLARLLESDQEVRQASLVVRPHHQDRFFDDELSLVRQETAATRQLVGILNRSCTGADRKCFHRNSRPCRLSTAPSVLRP